MKENTLNPKLLGFAILLGVLAIAISITMYLQVSAAGGFTGPSGAPPTGVGLLAADNGMLGVGTDTPTSLFTVNGEMSVLGNRILGVATPVELTDAVNKEYADAAGGADGEYYQTYCGWEDVIVVLASLGMVPPGAGVRSCTPPICSGTDTSISISCFSTAAAATAFDDPIAGAQVYQYLAGPCIRVCQVTP